MRISCDKNEVNIVELSFCRLHHHLPQGTRMLFVQALPSFLRCDPLSTRAIPACVILNANRNVSIVPSSRSILFCNFVTPSITFWRVRLILLFGSWRGHLHFIHNIPQLQIHKLGRLTVVEFEFYVCKLSLFVNFSSSARQKARSIW